MRNFAIVMLSLVFMSSQYARHLSYLQCRFANYFISAGEKCDCAAILKNDKRTIASYPALPQRHMHLDDSDWFVVTSGTSAGASRNSSEHSGVDGVRPCAGVVAGLLRPPRIS